MSPVRQRRGQRGKPGSRGADTPKALRQLTALLESDDWRSESVVSPDEDLSGEERPAPV